MPRASRRGFIKIAGAGVAATGVGGLASAIGTSSAFASGPTNTTAADHSLPSGAQGALVAYVRDVQAGEVAVLADGREVTVVDHQLVARLAGALHSQATDA